MWAELGHRRPSMPHRGRQSAHSLRIARVCTVAPGEHTGVVQQDPSPIPLPTAQRNAVGAVRGALVLALSMAVAPSVALADDCTPPAPLAKEEESCGGHTNDGCNDLSHPTEPIIIGVPIAATFWANETQRDTDFYRFVVTEPTAVIARAWGSVTMQLAVVDHCTVLGSGAGTCIDASACLAPGVYNVFVAPLESYPTCGAPETTYSVLLSLDSAAPSCTPLLGDIDRDGAINGIDLFHILNRWGSVDPGSCDLNGDQRADGLDLGVMLSNWTG